MTLTELQYIVALAEEEHFGRAANRCCVSQPTLSIAVKKLEDELALCLFERSKQGVKLTPVGEQIVVKARRILDWHPLFDLDQALSSTIDWYKEFITHERTI